MDAVAREQWALAVLTAHFDFAQQEFFQAEYGRRKRNPAAALALCLTLGMFGAHQFYLGRLRSATLRLLFCWTLIPAALALLESLTLTRWVYEYNSRMAHNLAAIVEETFAAVRAHNATAERIGAVDFPHDQAGINGIAPERQGVMDSTLSREAPGGNSQRHVPPTTPERATSEGEYAERTTTYTPMPAIMVTGRAAMATPLLGDSPEAAVGKTVPDQRRFYRVVMRNVAFVDGLPVAEVTASRDIRIDGVSDGEREIRLNEASAAAREEAAQKLAALIPLERPSAARYASALPIAVSLGNAGI